MARKPARARRPKKPKAKGKRSKKTSGKRSRAEEEEVILEEEKYSYSGTFKPKRDET